jgi:DNA-binding MarR family transcriptional regulator
MAKKKLISEPLNVHSLFRDRLCYTLTKTGVLFRLILEKSLEDYHIIPPQAGILHILSGYGDFNQLLLGQEMSIDKASMVKFIDGLEKLKLVKRKVDPKDRRAKLVTLTEKGKKTQKEISKLHLRLENEVLGNFSEKEMNTLRELMPRALEAVLDHLNME